MTVSFSNTVWNFLTKPMEPVYQHSDAPKAPLSLDREAAREFANYADHQSTAPSLQGATCIQVDPSTVESLDATNRDALTQDDSLATIMRNFKNGTPLTKGLNPESAAEKAETILKGAKQKFEEIKNTAPNTKAEIEEIRGAIKDVEAAQNRAQALLSTAKSQASFIKGYDAASAVTTFFKISKITAIASLVFQTIAFANNDNDDGFFESDGGWHKAALCTAAWSITFAAACAKELPALHEAHKQGDIRFYDKKND